MNKSIIKLIVHEHAWQLYHARRDEADITNQPLVEKPFWLENTETGQLYHDIYGCIGYPSEVTEKDEGMPGYIAIVGIVRPNDEIEHYNPINAKFQLLAEAQDKDVGTLLSKAVDLRERYGLGVQPDLLRVWYGDPDRFLTTLALRNEDLIRAGGDRNAVLITPPVDFYEPKGFDNYLRSLKSCIMPGGERFYFGGNLILKNHLKEFRRDNPAVFAIGGLVHSLLTVTSWCDEVGGNIFSIEEGE